MFSSRFDLYKKEWLDLVFTDRNKNYGAYDLRVHYGEYVFRAMAITFGLFITGGVAVKVFNTGQDQTKYLKPVVVETHPYIQPPKEIKKDKVYEAKPQHQKTASRPIVHVAMQASPIPNPTMEPVKEDKFTPQSQITNPGPITTQGDGKPQTTIIDGPPGNDPNSKSGGDAPASNDPMDIVEVMPEPIGGMAAWSKFLQRNIRYPDTDVEGKVYLSFIVERDGKITNVTLIKGVSTLLDEEAMRVLKIAPAWKPGRQNGQAVRVKYTLPVNFQVSQ